MKKKISLMIVFGIFLILTPSCKKCYNCIHPDGPANGYPDREICAKGLLGKSLLEIDRSFLTDEGYNCR
jgi:hypothetical protein